MASISDILEKPAAKVGIAVIAVAAIGIVAFQLKSSSVLGGNEYGTQVSADQTVSDAQKSIEQLQANKTLPENVKAMQIQHFQAIISQAKGHAPKSGPPTTGGSS